MSFTYGPEFDSDFDFEDQPEPAAYSAVLAKVLRYGIDKLLQKAVDASPRDRQVRWAAADNIMDSESSPDPRTISHIRREPGPTAWGEHPDGRVWARPKATWDQILEDNGDYLRPAEGEHPQLIHLAQGPQGTFMAFRRPATPNRPSSPAEIGFIKPWYEPKLYVGSLHHLPRYLGSDDPETLRSVTEKLAHAPIEEYEPAKDRHQEDPTDENLHLRLVALLREHKLIQEQLIQKKPRYKELDDIFGPRRPFRHKW